MACGTFDEMCQKKNKSVLFFNLLLSLATILKKEKKKKSNTGNKVWNLQRAANASNPEPRQKKLSRR